MTQVDRRVAILEKARNLKVEDAERGLGEEEAEQEEEEVETV